jgi:hypothetical protein
MRQDDTVFCEGHAQVEGVIRQKIETEESQCRGHERSRDDKEKQADWATTVHGGLTTQR